MKLKPNQFYLPSGALITELPILFQTEMVKAILEGRKTQTRRHIKGQPTGDDAINLKDVFNHNPEYFYEICKYGKPGDLLWAKETWAPLGEKPNHNWIYKSDVSQPYFKWKPSIHMPKAASRIWLMIEDIRVERVQEISQIDAQAEGIEPVTIHGEIKWKRYDEGLCTEYPTISFKTLWISINGEESWQSNPWVWVIKYRILSKIGRPSLEVIEKNYLEVTSSPSGEAGWGRKEEPHA